MKIKAIYHFVSSWLRWEKGRVMLGPMTCCLLMEGDSSEIGHCDIVCRLYFWLCSEGCWIVSTVHCSNYSRSSQSLASIKFISDSNWGVFSVSSWSHLLNNKAWSPRMPETDLCSSGYSIDSTNIWIFQSHANPSHWPSSAYCVGVMPIKSSTRFCSWRFVESACLTLAPWIEFTIFKAQKGKREIDGNKQTATNINKQPRGLHC